MSYADAEEAVQRAVEWLRLLVKTLGAVVIAVGVAVAVVGLIRHALHARGTSFTPVRLSFARFLALELQLAADILSTSVAPTWERIGKLAAIAIIRTALNYFLSREMKDEQASRGACAARSCRGARCAWKTKPCEVAGRAGVIAPRCVVFKKGCAINRIRMPERLWRSGYRRKARKYICINVRCVDGCLY